MRSVTISNLPSFWRTLDSVFLQQRSVTVPYIRKDPINHGICIAGFADADESLPERGGYIAADRKDESGTVGAIFPQFLSDVPLQWDTCVEVEI